MSSAAGRPAAPPVASASAYKPSAGASVFQRHLRLPSLHHHLRPCCSMAIRSINPVQQLSLALGSCLQGISAINLSTPCHLGPTSQKTRAWATATIDAHDRGTLHHLETLPLSNILSSWRTASTCSRPSSPSKPSRASSSAASCFCARIALSMLLHANTARL